MSMSPIRLISRYTTPNDESYTQHLYHLTIPSCTLLKAASAPTPMSRVSHFQAVTMIDPQLHAYTQIGAEFQCTPIVYCSRGAR